MPNLTISKSRGRSTSNHSRRPGSGRNNNRRTQGGKKKQQGSNKTAAAIAPYIPKPLSDMHTNFRQKFERLSSLIDECIDGIVPTSLCADIRDGLVDPMQEVADDAKSMFDERG